MFSSRSSILNSGIIRKIHLSVCLHRSHYDALGLTPRATQNDIKAAYYKLSMLYHPDKNSGSEIAAQKFRDINAAYEVLGNLRLRKLYDKGVLRSDFQHSHPSEPKPEDDAQTKFYKSHAQRTKAPAPTGRTPIYDFDEWSKAHYAASFQKKLKHKRRREYVANYQADRKEKSRSESVIFGLAVMSALVLIMTITVTRDDYDEVLKLNSEIPQVLNANDED